MDDKSNIHNYMLSPAILKILFTEQALITSDALYKLAKRSIWKRETSASFLHPIQSLIKILYWKEKQTCFISY